MEYKKLYSQEEIDELIAWFEAHKEDLPKSLDVDKATHMADFRSTVKNYMDIARLHRENATYSGQIYFLFQMRDAVKAACRIND